MTRTTRSKPAAWWVKLLAVIGLLLCVDSCTDRSSQLVTVRSKEIVQMSSRSHPNQSIGGNGFMLEVDGPDGRWPFFVSADAFNGIAAGDHIEVQKSLVLGRYRGVAKNGQAFSDLNFWNILLFFLGVACLLPLFQAVLLNMLRRLFGRWLPGL